MNTCLSARRSGIATWSLANGVICLPLSLSYSCAGPRCCCSLFVVVVVVVGLLSEALGNRVAAF